MKNIIIFVNNFGFGPAALAVAVAQKLHDHVPEGTQIHVVTSGFSDYLFEEAVSVTTVSDLRGATVLKGYLEQFDPKETVVVSSMNRFAITAATELAIPTVLIDGLFWFWRNRPKEYDLADYQIWCVLPWQIDEKRKSTAKNQKIVSAPVTLVANASYPEVQRVISTNGYITPYHSSNHDVYLSFISRYMQAEQMVFPKVKETILTSSPYAVDHLRQQLSDDKHIRLLSMSQAEYHGCVQHASEVWVNGGMSSFLEALCLRRPFVFFLPSNQSQFALIAEVARTTGLAITTLCPALALFNTFSQVGDFNSEDEAIGFISELLQKFLDSPDTDAQLNAVATAYAQAAKQLHQQPAVQRLYDSAVDSLYAAEHIAEGIGSFIRHTTR